MTEQNTNEQPLAETEVAVDPANDPQVTPNTDPLPEEQPTEDVEPHDEEDVEAILSRDASDGSGLAEGESVPKSDFDGFAEENVEVEDQ